MTTIFISYSRVDTAFMQSLVPYLRRTYGYSNVWVDDNLRGGQSWWDEIVTQISRCDIFILLVSKDSLDSDYCMKELNEARQHEKHIIPVLVRARTTVPPDIKKLHMVKMPDGVEKDGLLDLIIAINGRGSKPSPPSAPVTVPKVQNLVAEPTRPSRFAPDTRPALGRLVATLPSRAKILADAGHHLPLTPPLTPVPVSAGPKKRPARKRRGWWPVGWSLITLMVVALGVFAYWAQAEPTTDESVHLPVAVTMVNGVPPSHGLTLYYDENTLYLVNEAAEPLDASGLFFVHGERAFHSDNWRDAPLGRLEPGECVQVWSQEVGKLPRPPMCASRGRWRQVAPSGVFWQGEGAFDVRRNGVKMESCPVAAGRCALLRP